MKRGKTINIHGSFKKKADAMRKERKVKNGFILKRKIHGDVRYIVLSRR